MKKFILCSALILGLARGSTANDSALAPNASESNATTGPIQLRYNLQPNARYSTQIDIDLKTTTIYGKEKTDMLQKVTFIYDTRILNVDDSGIDMRIFFKALRMSMASKDFKVNYDSAKPRTSQKPPATRQEQAELFIGRMMGALVGQTVEYKVSQDGKTIGIKGQEAALQRMVNHAQFPKGAETAQFRQSLRDLIKNVVGGSDKPNQMTGMFTTKPVSVGESWHRSEVAGGALMPLQSDLTYTLKSRENGVAYLNLVGYMFDGPKTKARGNSLFSNTQISGEQKGQMQIHEKTGWPLLVDVEFRSVTEVDLDIDKKHHVKTYTKGSTRMKSSGG